MKKILHVFDKMDRGGAETFIMNLYEIVNKKEYEFSFLVHNNSEGHYDKKIKEYGGNIFKINRPNLFNYFDYRKSWNKLLTEHDFDVIHVHFISISAFFSDIVHKKGIKLISHSHSSSTGRGIKGKIKKTFINKGIKKSNELIACSLSSASEEFSSMKDFHLIYNGVSSNKFLFNNEKRNAIRESMNISSSLVIGHVGRFDDVKNHVFLIDIFNELFKENNNSKLVLIGEGANKMNIQQLVNEKELTNNVIFLGSVDNIYDYLNIFDIFIFPSLWEGLPLALIEAQFNGVNLLISDTISKEVIRNNNVLIESLNTPPEIWAEKALSMNVNYDRKDISDNMNDFDIEVVSRQILSLYNRK